jgi:hypothetical protein
MADADIARSALIDAKAVHLKAGFDDSLTFFQFGGIESSLMHKKAHNAV